MTTPFPIYRVSPDHIEALKVLRGHLKYISAQHPGVWFKADLIDGGVMIRMFEQHHGIEQTVALTRQSDALLRNVDRPDFRSRLIDELIRQNFPIEKDKVGI